MTGAAAPSRSSTWPNSSGPPPQGSGMSPSPASISPPTSPNSRIRSASSPRAIRRRSARLRASMARIRSYRDSQDGRNWRARCDEPSWPRLASAARAPGSIASPTCQSPVPALSTTTAPSRPAAASSARSTVSAIGERQMLPRQTRQTRYGAPGSRGDGSSAAGARAMTPAWSTGRLLGGRVTAPGHGRLPARAAWPGCGPGRNGRPASGRPGGRGPAPGARRTGTSPS